MTLENLRRVNLEFGSGLILLSNLLDSDLYINDRFEFLQNFADFSDMKIDFLKQMDGRMQTEPWSYLRTELPLQSAYAYYEALKQMFGEADLLNDPYFYEAGFDLAEEISGFAYVLASDDMCIYVVSYDSRSPIPLFQLSVVGPKNNLDTKLKMVKGELETKSRSAQDKVKPPEMLTEFSNPFHFYFSQARAMLSVIQSMQQSSALEHGSSQSKTNSLGVSPVGAFFLFIASLEGLINLIYELYLDPSFRNDGRIHDVLKKSPIDIKIRLAPAYCTCFREKAIVFNEDFKRFKVLTELRHDLIHANLTKAMVTPHFILSGITFKIPSLRKRHYGMPDTPGEINATHLQFVCDTIEGMVNLILRSMKVRYEQELSRVIHQDNFVARFVDGEYVIDFDS